MTIKDGDFALEPSISPTPLERCSCGGNLIDHGHRDLPFTEKMTKADFVVHDVKSAIDKIFELEKNFPEK